MKQPLTRRRLILLGLVLVLILGLGLALRTSIRDLILLPLIDLAWLLWVQSTTVPQGIFWGLFVLIALVMVYRSLKDAFAPAPLRVKTPQAKWGHFSRYHHWKHGLETLPGSPFSRERVERELQTLVLQVLAEQERTDLDDMRLRQQRGELDLAAQGPAIQSLFTVKGLTYPDSPSIFRVWWARLLKRPIPVTPGSEPLDAAAVVAWLEKQTGITLS